MHLWFKGFEIVVLQSTSSSTMTPGTWKRSWRWLIQVCQKLWLLKLFIQWLVSIFYLIRVQHQIRQFYFTWIWRDFWRINGNFKGMLECNFFYLIHLCDIFKKVLNFALYENYYSYSFKLLCAVTRMYFFICSDMYKNSTRNLYYFSAFFFFLLSS